jgi:hypothetical protein
MSWIGLSNNLVWICDDTSFKCMSSQWLLRPRHACVGLLCMLKNDVTSNLWLDTYLLCVQMCRCVSSLYFTRALHIQTFRHIYYVTQIRPFYLSFSLFSIVICLLNRVCVFVSFLTFSILVYFLSFFNVGFFLKFKFSFIQWCFVL